MAAKQEDTLIYRIARYYYPENLSQNEIAQIEQISRSRVSAFWKEPAQTDW